MNIRSIVILILIKACIYLWSVCYFRLFTFDLKVLPIIFVTKAKAAFLSSKGWENDSYIFR